MCWHVTPSIPGRSESLLPITFPEVVYYWTVAADLCHRWRGRLETSSSKGGSLLPLSLDGCSLSSYASLSHVRDWREDVW